ncbi:MAG: hypothetical protein NTZ83_05915, partial [Candidatus Pacearchaeota archaeon]|nr:hypothetical protein [Candidatus Pacearchaeota archaeon]
IGIARTFSYHGEKKVWDISSSGNPIKILTRNLDLTYFKLPIAKELAKEKVKITKDFCDSFIKEYSMGINN